MCQSEDGDSNVLEGFACSKCVGNVGESVKHKEELFSLLETDRFYLSW